MKRAESRRNHVVSKCSLFFNVLNDFEHETNFETVIACMEQILTAELSDIFTASGSM